MSYTNEDKTESRERALYINIVYFIIYCDIAVSNAKDESLNRTRLRRRGEGSWSPSRRASGSLPSGRTETLNSTVYLTLHSGNNGDVAGCTSLNLIFYDHHVACFVVLFCHAGWFSCSLPLCKMQQ